MQSASRHGVGAFLGWSKVVCCQHATALAAPTRRSRTGFALVRAGTGDDDPIMYPGGVPEFVEVMFSRPVFVQTVRRPTPGTSALAKP